MKLALLATLLTFGGSLAGFGLTAGAGGSPAPVASSPHQAASEDIVLRGKDRDCPKAQEVEKT
jgi:hypothetical protein